VDEDAHHIKKSIQIVSEQGIKGPDTMANLVWANTFLGKYVNAYLGRHCYTQHVSTYIGLCIFALQLASMHWHAIGTK